MPDFIFPALTTATTGISTTSSYIIQTTSSYDVSTTNGTISIGNTSFSITLNTTPAIPARRSTLGQVFPRGVYNK